MWDPITTDTCEVCVCPIRPKRPQNPFMDKENLQLALSPMKTEDISFYGSASPAAPICTGTSPNHCNHNLITRRPLEDHDPNSSDSGYHTNYHGDGGNFTCYASPSRGSFEAASIGSMEDEFFEDFSDLEPLEENLPQNFNKLISAPITSQNKKTAVKSTSPKDLVIRPLFRRALSLQNDRIPPISSKVRSCLFKPVTESRPFKRPEPPQEFESPINSKKMKVIDDIVPSVPSVQRPLLQRAFSATEESIMSAVQRSMSEPDLIGDFSKGFSLPLTPGRHQDLKSITPVTLAKLMNGEFDANVASFKVIDCRYPYEFEGGHIEGAINVYTKDQCMELLNKVEGSPEQGKKSNILVFHCEFSSERGPNLYRYLREQDRQLNLAAYPLLHYPEVYLLEGGYKNFFEQFSHLCAPIAYTEMLHPDHENELRYFRLKCKTWNADSRGRSQSRTQLKRLGI